MERMTRSSLGLALCAAALATPAMAKDFCLSNNGTDLFVVGKGFKIPSKGQCKPFGGFFEGSDLVSGNACTRSDGSAVYLNLNFSPGGGVENDNITLSLPSMTGTGFDCYDRSGGTGAGLLRPILATSRSVE